jgi:hypothetical protein
VIEFGIGKFSITKARALAVFLNCPMNIMNGLSQLGDELSLVSDGTLNIVTRYVNLLYAKRKEDRDAVCKFHDTGKFNGISSPKINRRVTCYHNTNP